MRIMSRSAARTRSALAMIVPSGRVVLRRVRRARSAGSSATVGTSFALDGRTVELTTGRSRVRIDGQDVGEADVRRDHGTSTVEAWMQVAAEAAPLVVRAVEAQSDGVRRIAWLVVPGTPEASAVEAAGYERESVWAPPLARAGTPHELWARITRPPAAR